MIVIADSGSTKTDWAVVEGKRIKARYSSRGLNPNLLSMGAIVAFVGEAVPAELAARRDIKLYFYGAGCGTPERQKEMEEALRQHFPYAAIVVEPDILGAARALLGKTPGLAAIIGTGSNTVVYDGLKITGRLPSTGYILGDEGSGNALGKRLLQLWFRDELETSLRERLERDYNMDYAAVMDALYRQPMPNRYLASFARFVGEHRHVPQMRQLAEEVFDEYFRYQPVKLSCQWRKIGFVGSVALHFREILEEVARRYDFEVADVIDKPVNQLAEYHSKDEL